MTAEVLSTDQEYTELQELTETEDVIKGLGQSALFVNHNMGIQAHPEREHEVTD